MEQIIQLKTMRDEALERLQNNPDFKLVNSLDALIRDLEAVLAAGESASVNTDAKSEAAADVPAMDKKADAGSDSSDDMVANDAPASDEGALDSGVEAEIEELASSDPEAVSSAIEALEAELSQASSEHEEVVAQPGSMIN